MKVSVCMATYNGSKFVLDQLRSILSQLGQSDEVVIVDDCSTDDTIRIISEINDPRVVLLRNKKNLGVIRTFDTALANARGDLIFLSDQDDIWLPNRVVTMSNVFYDCPRITLVLSGMEPIDAQGKLIAEELYSLTLGTSWGAGRAIRHVIQPRYYGCCIAFKREMLEYILPIPKDVPMHDMWIGIVNDIFGKTFYIPQPFIQYRRHGSNATRNKHGGVGQILLWRYALVKNLLLLLYSVWLRRRRIIEEV